MKKNPFSLFRQWLPVLLLVLGYHEPAFAQVNYQSLYNSGNFSKTIDVNLAVGTVTGVHDVSDCAGVTCRRDWSNPVATRCLSVPLRSTAVDHRRLSARITCASHSG
jgi:hypothetical protein